MAQNWDTFPHDINTYILLTGSNETEARNMLNLYGDLNFAVSQYHESQVSSNGTNTFADHSLLGADQLVTSISEDLTYPVRNHTEVYLKSFNGDIESATNSLLQEGGKTLEAQRYLSTYNNNVMLAIHQLLEEKNKTDISDVEDGGVFEAARVYLNYFGDDLERAVNTLMEINGPNLNTAFRTEARGHAKIYLDALRGDFEIAFNILLQVHQPDMKDEIYSDYEMVNIHPFPGKFDADDPKYTLDGDDRYVTQIILL